MSSYEELLSARGQKESVRNQKKFLFTLNKDDMIAPVMVAMLEYPTKIGIFGDKNNYISENVDELTGYIENIGKLWSGVNNQSCTSAGNPEKFCRNIREASANPEVAAFLSKYVDIRSGIIKINVQAIRDILNFKFLSLSGINERMAKGKEALGSFKGLEVVGQYVDNIKALNFKDLTKLVRNRLLAVTEAKPVDVFPSIPSEEGSFVSLNVPQNKFNREKNGDLVMQDENGHTVKVNDEAQMLHMLRADCYGTGAKELYDADGNSLNKCTKFMFECLLSNDENALDQCISNLQVKGFANAAVDDIKNLHPILALRILQQFGFHKYKVHDSQAGFAIYKVESVDSWIKNYLTKHFAPQKLGELLNNGPSQPLFQYLNLMAQFVNANPAILNKGFSGKSREAVGIPVLTEFANKLGLKPEQINKATRIYELNRLRNHLVWATPNIRSNVLRSPFGTFTPGVSMMQSRSGFGGLTNMMMGGGDKCDNVYAKLNNSGQVLGSTLIEKYLNAVILDFNHRGKSLDSQDERRMKDRVAQLKKLEDDLMKTLCYIDEFNSLADTFGDYSSGTMSEGTLTKLIERAETIVSKQQGYYGNVLDYLTKIVNVLDDNTARERVLAKDLI